MHTYLEKPLQEQKKQGGRKAVTWNLELKHFMYEADYLEYSDQDWKAIMMNVLRSYEDQPVTDEEIRNEIDIFYNA